MTSRQSRVARLVNATEAGVRGLLDMDNRAVNRALQIAVAWSPEFLANPLGPVWDPTFSEVPIRQDLLRGPLRARNVEDVGRWVAQHGYFTTPQAAEAVVSHESALKLLDISDVIPPHGAPHPAAPLPRLAGAHGRHHPYDHAIATIYTDRALS